MSALGWVLSLGAVGTLGALLWGLWERGRRQRLGAELVAAKAQAADAYRQFRELQEATADERRRLEFVIVSHKREIALLEEDVRACSGLVPAGVVLDRVQRLLSTPVNGLGTTSSAVVVPPPAPTTGR